MKSIGLIEDSEKSTVWRVIYGCSAGCAVFAGIVGRTSPGLVGILIYLGLGWVTIAVQQRYGKSLYKTALCTLGIGLIVIPPTRLFCIALRELGEVSWHLDALSNASIIFFIMVGASSIILPIFKKQTDVEKK